MVRKATSGSATQLASLSPSHREHLRNIAVQAARLERGGAGLREFMIDYYRGVDEEDLLQRDPRLLAQAALVHLALARTRPARTACVAVYNPTEATHGWQSPHTCIDIACDDMAFLVDSVGMVCARHSLNVYFLAHPVLKVLRTAAGRWRGVGGVGVAESWQHLEVDHVEDPTALQALEQELREVLADVSRANRDWRAMQRRAQALAQQRDVPLADVAALQEGQAFIAWLADNHFTFLGSQEFTLRRGRSHDVLAPIAGSALGIMRKGAARQAGALELSGELREHARATQRVLITKSSALSTVHRAAHLDHISVKHFDAQGRVKGETRFLGLLTSGAYSAHPSQIPLLRDKTARVMEALQLTSGSHDAKAAQHILDTYPRDELFQADLPYLLHTVRGIMGLQERRRVRLFMRRDPFRRFYACLLYLPRDRYNTQVRERIEGHLLAALNGSEVESQVQLGDSALARLHLLIRTSGELKRPVSEEALERDITHLTRTWMDEFTAALLARHGEVEGRLLAQQFAHAFPAAYQADVPPSAAIDDVTQLRSVANNDQLALRLIQQGQTHFQHHLHLRLILRGSPLPLSDVLPMLENMGLRVLTERPYEIEPARAKSWWIQDFEIETPRDVQLDPTQLDASFREAFLAVWQGRCDNDGFNRLIVLAPLPWRAVQVLRAICRYLIQSTLPFSQAYMEQTLNRHHALAARLWQLFETRFAPGLSATTRNARMHTQQAAIEAALIKVTSSDEDRILRAYLGVITAMLRTNFYQRDAQGKPKRWLSFKLRSANITHLPQPRPLYEIFVHSPQMEGVHLRMATVARGGLRWSDRREDFRTEILGLMKAQTVKNAVIVPMGAKGGFVVKRTPTGATREDVQREGIECYRTFIRGLLDLTDNVVKGRNVPPADTVRHDDDDPYLVVAADKGTAAFSDIANALAAEYDFWLGDAFASGGSAGYDHKKMAITARGAWVCVQRHFRELGHDVQKQPFTTIGIGDMAGDVFGNGMLRSPQTKLLAAFNHQHIFLDPTPDVATSFRERQRLFDLPRSSWADYDSKLISAGGGVYERSAKSIRISAQAQAMLGITQPDITPTALIKAILCMPVDLLWNGGIGTYVKASHEIHAEVGDRTNDAVRVDGRDLRCKVVGEGGNLGFTQRGRIEYALQGGRINTDFIDNSGGVDCSDHEVNIKILLRMTAEKGLTLTRRNQLLNRMTDEVAQLVLRDNYLQSLALSVAEAVAPKRLQEHAHLIRSLELAGELDRELERLPDVEAIAARQQAGKGLTRPELSVLLSYGKLSLYRKLIASDVAEDPYLRQELTRYFPAVLSQRYAALLPKHRLHREIIATATTNSMINRMGPNFALRLQEDTGADAATVARAYAIAREAFAMRDIWTRIEALDDRVATAVQYAALQDSTRLLRHTTYWLIRHRSGALDIQAQVQQLRTRLLALANKLPEVLRGIWLERFQERREQFESQRMPATLAAQVAALPLLHAAPDIVDLALQVGVNETLIARQYFHVSEVLSLDWLHEQIADLNVVDHWQAVARNTLRNQLYELQRQLTVQVLDLHAGTADDAVERWQQRQAEPLRKLGGVLKEMRSQSVLHFAALSVALQAIRELAQPTTPVAPRRGVRTRSNPRR